MSVLWNFPTLYGKTPVWLAEMTRGATVYRYHLGKDDVRYGGETYLGSSLDFDQINYSAEILKDDFTLTGFPLSDATTQALIAAGRIPLTLRMLRGFQGSHEYVVSFIGTLTNLQFRDREVSLVFSSWADDLSRGSPGAVAQRQCTWRLYSTECGVDQASFEISGTAVSYSDGVVSVNEGSDQSDGYYTGGILTYAGESRTIEKHSGDDLTLSSGFLALSEEIDSSGSAIVSIAAGCDKSATTCNGRFSNIARHGGFIAMADNPFFESVF